MVKVKKRDVNQGKFIARLVVFSAITLTFIAFSITLLLNGRLLEFGGSLLIITLILAFAVPYVMRMRESLKHNLPLDDERSRKIMQGTAALSFYISLYFVLFISFFIGDFAVERLSLVTNIIVGCMAIIFGISYLITRKRMA